ncbi:ricin-type beta-trefoil lectin domain protein [Micromonospora zhanjiangensis]
MTRRIGWLPRSAAATIVAGLAVLAAIAATISWGIATARNDATTGRSVTAEQMTAIVSAARSCPMLTPARVAGQLMAESGLDNKSSRTASGGRGIAGLRDADWKKWAPWPDAKRGDSSANILALAHQMCDLSGQLRLAKTPGDPWRLALSAFHSGVPAVRDAGGVTSASGKYVDQASGYATYYAKLPAFGGAGNQPLGTASPPADAKPLPAQYVPSVLAAGQVCQQVSPAQVASVLMAASAFDPNRLGADGAQGIAQFLPDVWQRYAPKGASAWDPTVAIPVVGTAMCGMITELAGLPGDPYLLSLAALRVGPTTVRQSGGTPDAATKAFIDRVASFTAYYRLDTRLSATAAPSTAPSSGSPTPKATGTKPTTKPTATAAAPPPPGKPDTPLPGKSFVQKQSGKCLDAGAGVDGTHLTLRTCSSGSASQRWDIRGDGTIRSVLTGLCMDVAWGNTATGTLVQTANCSGNPAQQWKVESNWIRSLLANKCIDSVGNNPTNGTEINIWDYVGNPKQTFTAR